MADIEHDFSDRADGLIWCDTEGVPSDFCNDEERCANGCICNIGDPDLREAHYDLYLNVYHAELLDGTVTDDQVMAMALVSARHAVDEAEGNET